MIGQYNKLVRDRIPDIIHNQGGVPKIRILDDENYIAALNQKLQEEVAEYFEAHDVGELADVAEVILAIAAHQGISVETFEEIRQKKREERGGFQGRTYLEEIERPRNCS